MQTHVGPQYRQWNVFLFKLDEIRTQMDSPVAVKAVRYIGNNGLYDLLLSCWIKLGIGGGDGTDVMWRDHDAPGRYILPWRTDLSSFAAIVEIKGYRVYAIVWCFIHAVPLLCFSVLVAVMDVTVSVDDVIPTTALSHMGGSLSERSEWLLQVSQWARLKALPMGSHWRTVAFFRKIGILYKCPVFAGRTSIDTTPVTGSLLFATPGCR